MDYHGPAGYKKPRRHPTRSERAIQRGRTYNRRYRIEFYDPEGIEYGIPTYPWKLAPPHLYTRRQLLAMNRRPAQPIQAQVLWMHGKQLRVAHLYDIALAKPKRIPTLAQLHAIEKALTARRTCPLCDQVRNYTIPTSLGCCVDCNQAHATAA